MLSKGNDNDHLALKDCCLVCQGSYVAFLPGDNYSANDVRTVEVVKVLNGDLANLLRLPSPQFWQAVTSDSSLVASLDSYLHFCRWS